MDKKQDMKARGEDAAAAYLERVGVCVVERNWRCEQGAIDIVAFDGDMLVMVAVKTRWSTGRVVERSLSATAKRRVAQMANAYLEYADLDGTPWRYDEVCLLVISEDRALLRHHRDAMSAES